MPSAACRIQHWYALALPQSSSVLWSLMYDAVLRFIANAIYIRIERHREELLDLSKAKFDIFRTSSKRRMEEVCHLLILH